MGDEDEDVDAHSLVSFFSSLTFGFSPYVCSCSGPDPNFDFFPVLDLLFLELLFLDFLFEVWEAFVSIFSIPF